MPPADSSSSGELLRLRFAGGDESSCVAGSDLKLACFSGTQWCLQQRRLDLRAETVPVSYEDGFCTQVKVLLLQTPFGARGEICGARDRFDQTRTCTSQLAYGTQVAKYKYHRV